MKILTEREKKILINHAKKQELRRIISKEKKEKQKALPSREIKRRTSEIYFRKSI